MFGASVGFLGFELCPKEWFYNKKGKITDPENTFSKEMNTKPPSSDSLKNFQLISHFRKHFKNPGSFQKEKWPGKIKPGFIPSKINF